MTGTQDKALLSGVLRQLKLPYRAWLTQQRYKVEQTIRQVLIEGFYEPLILPKNRI